VKYAQCVKIWLFLMCVQFLKSCVQFLMDTTLNLVIVQFVMKIKGDTPTKRASPISIKGRHALNKRVYGSASPFYLTTQKRLSIEYSLWDAP
jgi:hypothetical protein